MVQKQLRLGEHPPIQTIAFLECRLTHHFFCAIGFEDLQRYDMIELYCELCGYLHTFSFKRGKLRVKIHAVGKET